SKEKKQCHGEARGKKNKKVQRSEVFGLKKVQNESKNWLSMEKVAEKATCRNGTSPKLNPRKEVQMSARLPRIQSPKSCAAVEKSSARQEEARCRLDANPRWDSK
ncbi:hypothetical protein KI387_036236, partial [Taxus chinensis]